MNNISNDIKNIKSFGLVFVLRTVWEQNLKTQAYEDATL